MRIFVTGNIHGRLPELKILLEQVEFSDKDILVLLGNYLYKGSYQQELIEYLIELSKKKNIAILRGDWENHYLKALFEDDFISEQKITSDRNIFYNYLDDKELRNRHLKFLSSLSNSVLVKNIYFSSNKQIAENMYSIFSDSDIDSDYEDNNSYISINFSKSLGLYEVNSKKTIKLSSV